jgi:DnaJ like chaperone protein
MAKFGKWIAGGLGWALLGPIGGLIGFALGSIFENASGQQMATGDKRTTSGAFAMSLLVLVAAVMKADGKVLRSELDYVKKFFLQNFGADTSQEAIVMLRDLLKQPIPVQDVCRQIKQNLDYSSRLQLVHFLYGISMADGEVHPSEQKAIEQVAGFIGISAKDKDSIKYMFVPQTDSAYKILEIDRSVTDDEVKKAYRKMANKFHPDKVGHLGEDFQKVANEKFQKVNEAYEKIKKERKIA